MDLSLNLRNSKIFFLYNLCVINVSYTIKMSLQVEVTEDSTNVFNHHHNKTGEVSIPCMPKYKRHKENG